MKNIYLSRIRVQAATKVSALLALAVIVIAFFVTPCISLAHEASSDNSSSSNDAVAGKQGKLGLPGVNGCLNKQNISRQDSSLCIRLPDLGNLTPLCGNDATDVVTGDDQENKVDCPGIPDLGNLISLCKFLGVGNNNPNSLAAGTKRKDIENCLGIPDLSNLTSLCKFLGVGNNNPNSLAAGTKRKDITNCLGIPDLSNLTSLHDLTNIIGNNPSSIAARVRASSKQSSLSTAKLAGILQLATAEAGGRQTTSQIFAAQQGGSTLKFRIVPTQVASIRKGDFIGAYFNGKLEFGVGVGTGRAELFDPVTSQLTTVQLS